MQSQPKNKHVLLCLAILFLISIESYSQAGSYDADLFLKGLELESINRDSAIIYWTQEFDGASDQAIQYKADIAMILSKTYNTPRNCDKIKEWNLVAENLYTQLGSRRGSAEVLYQRGYHAFCLMDYEAALELFLAGLQIMEELGDDHGIALGHLRMSRIFHFTYKLPQSAEYGVLGGERFDRVGDHVQAWDSWSFAGHGFRMEQDSAQAINAFNKGLEAAERSGLVAIKGMAFNDLASFHMEYDMYTEAEAYFLKSLEMVDPSEERQIMVIQNGLSQVYLHTGRFEECIAISKKALATVYKTNDLFFLSELPEYVAKSYEGLGRYDSAYKYMNLNWKYSEELFTTNQDEALEEMKVKYETEKKELVIDKQNKERYYGLGLIGVLIALGLALWNRYQSKLQLSAVLKERNEEKDFLLKEIHHRVKNNLQILSSLLSLQSDAEDDDNIVGALQESRNRVESMSLIHQKLYTRDNVTAINMKDYVADLCTQMEDSYNSELRSVQIEHQVSIDMVDVETAIPLGLIINELITNSMKYAFVNKPQGLIRLSLVENSDGLQLDIKDNGNASLDAIESSSKSTQFGSRLIEILCKKLKGKIQINTDDGYHTSIAFTRYKLT